MDELRGYWNDYNLQIIKKTRTVFTWHLALGFVNIWTFQKLSAMKKRELTLNTSQHIGEH